jgi:phosphopantetheinyl transferase
LATGRETELGERDLHVWVVPLDDPDKRRRRELAHLAEGMLLAGYLGLTPAKLEFERGPAGKPQLAGAPLQFNLSHSDGLALVAVARRLPVGVDVQAPHPNASKPWFAKRVCTPQEYELFAADPRPELLLRLWARKEAVIKARGEGSYVGVGELDVRDDLVAGGWLCHDLELPGAQRYHAAVAVRHAEGDPQPDVTLRSFSWD